MSIKLEILVSLKDLEIARKTGVLRLGFSEKDESESAPAPKPGAEDFSTHGGTDSTEPSPQVKKSDKKAKESEKSEESSAPKKKSKESKKEESEEKPKKKAVVSEETLDSSESPKKKSKESPKKKSKEKKEESDDSSNKKKDDSESDKSDPPEEKPKKANKSVPLTVVKKPKGGKDWDDAPDYYTFAKGTNYIVYNGKIVGAWSKGGIRELSSADTKHVEAKGWPLKKLEAGDVKKAMKSLRE